MHRACDDQPNLAVVRTGGSRSARLDHRAPRRTLPRYAAPGVTMRPMVRSADALTEPHRATGPHGGGRQPD